MTNLVAEQALSRLDIEAPTWKTLVVLASADTDLVPEVIWHTWAEIGDWPSMSPLVSAAQWTRGQPWRGGSEFVQELNLGFPFGKETAEERVVAIEPGASAEWCRQTNSIQTVHVWRFDPLKSSGTRITNVEVFHGIVVGLAKAVVAPRWQRLFQAQVDGLIRTARERA